MTVAQLRKSAQETLKCLPPEQLKVAAEFIKYLDERASDEATEELLKIPGLLEDLEEAERDIAEGRTVSWREVRRDVRRSSVAERAGLLQEDRPLARELACRA